MAMVNRSLAAIAVIGLGLAFATPADARVCKNSVCAESTDDGRTINIYLTTKLAGMTHFNVRASPVYGQFENVRGRISLPVRRGQRVTYSVQVCKRGGALQKSFCTAWAHFHHDVDRPKDAITHVGPGRCPPGKVWRATSRGGYCMPARWR
jgi:hypothetical protein